MFFLIPFICAQEYIYNTKGYYSLEASKNDILSFFLQSNERAFILTSKNQNACFMFPNILNRSIIPTDFNSFSFDNSDFKINVLSDVNVSIWIIYKSFCHPNSIFVMSSYKYSLQIRPNIESIEYFNDENVFNYCIFSPSHLNEYRKVSFEQQKPEGSSSFSKSNIYSASVITPDYQTEGRFIEAILSNSFFIKISIPASSNSFDQVVKMSFIDEKVQDNSFVQPRDNSFYSSSYYYIDDEFTRNTDWIDDVKFSFEKYKMKKFSWVLIVIILFVMIILLLLSLFIIYIVIRKRNGSGAQSTQEEQGEECIPDAQSIDQLQGEPNEENNEENQSNDENTKNKHKKKDLESDNIKDNTTSNPYSITNITEETNEDDSDTIDLNVVEINPYSLPSA